MLWGYWVYFGATFAHRIPPATRWVQSFWNQKTYLGATLADQQMISNDGASPLKSYWNYLGVTAANQPTHWASLLQKPEATLGQPLPTSSSLIVLALWLLGHTDAYWGYLGVTFAKQQICRCHCSGATGATLGPTLPTSKPSGVSFGATGCNWGYLGLPLPIVIIDRS